MARTRRLLPWLLLILLVTGAGAARAASWFPAATVDDPGDLVSSELIKLNALSEGVQLFVGDVVESRSATALAFSGAAGVRFPGLGIGDFRLFSSLGGVLGDAADLGSLDLQVGSSHFYPRGSLLVPSRDLMFNLQLHLWLGDVKTAGAGDQSGFYGGMLGLPLLTGGSGNFVFRGLHDLVRWWHDGTGDHWQENLRGGILFTTANAFSFSLDGGVTSVFDDSRAWPVQASLWVAPTHWLTIGAGGGVLDLVHWRESSWGGTFVFTL